MMGKRKELPTWVEYLIQFTCPKYLIEGILGDLQEAYVDSQERGNQWRANVGLVWTTIRFIHPYLLIRKEKNSKLINMGLLLNYLRVVRRSMWKYRFYSVINLLGLSSALAFVFLCYFFIHNELNFDSFHEKRDRIYRLISYRQDAEGNKISEQNSGVVPIPLGGLIRENVNGVAGYTRFGTNSATVMKGTNPQDEVLAFADPDFLTIFDFPLLYGDRRSALDDPSSIMVSSEIAEKYFPGEDPMGQSMEIILNDSTKRFVVTAVIDDNDHYSSLRFDLVIPFERMEMILDERTMKSMNVAFTESYLLFDDPPQTDIFKVLTEVSGDKPGPDGSQWIVDVQLLSDMHLDTETGGLAVSTNPQKLIILSALGILVLVIAIINFITLSTGHAMNRVKEIGLRKTLGAYRKMLSRQLVFESLTTVAISGFLGILLAYSFMPLFNMYMDSEMTFSVTILHVVFAFGVIILIGWISGIIQSLLIVRYHPVDALKGKQLFSSRESWLNQGLVVVQFGLSIFLVIGTVIIWQQMQFILKKDLGYDQERLIELNLYVPDDPSVSEQLVDRYKNALSSEPKIISVGASMNNFQDPWTELAFRQVDESNVYLNFNQIDAGFIETMGLEMVDGEGFRPDQAVSAKSIIVNEALVSHFGWDNPLEQQIPGKNFDEPHEIIGVVEDFHFSSLHNEIEPLIIVLREESIVSGITGLSTYVWPPMLNRLIVRVGPGDLGETLQVLENTAREVNPFKPFSYHFVDDLIARGYEEEIRWNKVMNASSVFSLMIAWMGLLGLTRLSVQKRVKEIGIRKVLGSSVFNVTSLLSKRYLILVLLGNLIAWPVAWYGINQWLASFAYRIDLSFWIFPAAGLGVLLIAMISVGMQAYRAAIMDPVHSIKYE